MASRALSRICSDFLPDFCTKGGIILGLIYTCVDWKIELKKGVCPGDSDTDDGWGGSGGDSFGDFLKLLRTFEFLDNAVKTTLNLKLSIVLCHRCSKATFGY